MNLHWNKIRKILKIVDRQSYWCPTLIIADFIFQRSKIHRDGNCSHWNKANFSTWGKIAKSKTLKCKFLTLTIKYCQGYDFTSFNTWLWNLEHQKGYIKKNKCLWHVEKSTFWIPRRTKWFRITWNKTELVIGCVNNEIKPETFWILQSQESLWKALILGKTKSSWKRKSIADKGARYYHCLID